MDSNWMNSKLKISCLGMIMGIFTVILDIVPNFGELQTMLIVVILLVTSTYSEIINVKAGILGTIFVWIGIPIERLIGILNSAGTQKQYLQLIEFSLISLLLCLSGLFCVVVARKLSSSKQKLNVNPMRDL
jgi:hypothetical protein